MSALTEELGPRGQRRVQVGTVVSLVVFAAAAAWAVWRFLSEGEFAYRLWEEFTRFDVWRFLAVGLLNTLRAAIVGMVCATAIGFVLALTRLARTRVPRILSRVYTEVFRSIPLLTLIFFAYLGLQDYVNISIFMGLIIALTLYNSAVLGEIFRAGILSLDRGQSEAASAIGLTYWQSMRLVILPQAIRRMTPAIVAQLATLTKDTSLGFVISYEELLSRAGSIAQFEAINELQSFVVAAVVYFIVIYGLTKLARRLETKQRRKYGAGRISVAGGPEDLDAVGEDADEDEVSERERAGAGQR